MKDIFFTDQDELTGRFVVVDEQENAIWAYLTLPYEEKIDKSCFLGSRIKIEIEEVDLEEYKSRQVPPPLTKKFSNMESYSPSLSEEGLSVEWRKHGNVIIKINENPFLFFLEHEKNGFTKSIATNGGYGNTWNEMEYQKKFTLEEG